MIIFKQNALLSSTLLLLGMLLTLVLIRRREQALTKTKMFTRRSSVLVLFLGVFCFAFIFISYWSSKQTTHTLTETVAGKSAAKESQGELDSPEPSLETRKRRLHDYCLTHRFNEKPTQEELQYIAVDDENNIIYCALHKVSSKTWIELLEGARGIKGRVQRWEEFRRLGDYSEEEKLLRLQTYFKFMIVREPLQRLLSTFKERFTPEAGRHHQETSRLDRHRIVSLLRPNDLKPEEGYGDYGVSFSEFIQYFSGNVPRQPPCRQYERICHPCVINYDFIGHLETLKEDGPRILKMAGIDDRVTFPPIHKATDSDEVLEYYSQVPPRYIKQLGEHYRNDFEMFGYEYLGSVKKHLNQSFSNH